MYLSRRAGPVGPGRTAVLVWTVLFGTMLGSGASILAGVPDETCGDCHEEVAAAFSGTAHAKFLSGQPGLAGHFCESCHGDATAHVENADPSLILNPAKHDQFGGNELCLTCHDGSQFDDWAFSNHNTSGLSCASCHTVHTSEVAPPSSFGEEKCYSCHTDVRASASMPSHHPIGEGMLSCNDCHDPHGGEVGFAMGSSGRELCLSCHADVEGPFVYEHAPVTEDCMICHTPHGSVADNLLKQNEPALCLNCHPMHFHATIPGWDGNFPNPMAPERSGTSTPDGWKIGMLTKCTQCHTMVHGSDLPSQAASNGGTGLTR